MFLLLFVCDEGKAMAVAITDDGTSCVDAEDYLFVFAI